MSEEKKSPGYKHKEGKCQVECKFYENGYCKITGEWMVHSPPMGPSKALDCAPYLVDLRRAAKKEYPEYHDTSDLLEESSEEGWDEDLLDEFRSIMHESLEVLNRIDKKMSRLLKEVKLGASGE